MGECVGTGKVFRHAVGSGALLCGTGPARRGHAGVLYVAETEYAGPGFVKFLEGGGTARVVPLLNVPKVVEGAPVQTSNTEHRSNEGSALLIRNMSLLRSLGLAGCELQLCRV